MHVPGNASTEFDAQGAVAQSSAYVILLATIAAISGFLFGFDTAVINGVLFFLRKQFALSNLETEVAASSLLLGWHWLSMGLIVATGAALYVCLSVALSLNLVSPAARLSNAQDTLVGGSLADAVTCNAVVKSFGAEAREDA